MLLEFSERLDSIRPGQLPREVVEKAKTAIINFVGGSIPGADAEIVTAEKSLWRSQRVSGRSSIIGHKSRTAPLAAAAINAAMGQVFLQEDCHDSTISHPGVVVIPAALAVGQELHSDGAGVIAAVVAGYEAMGKIGKALILPGLPSNGLRPAAILAPFGACVAAAKLLGLGASGIRDAIGIAGNSAAGIMEFVNAGTLDICIQNCNAVKSGVMAAYEAYYGLAGADTILDGRFGLGWALNDRECDWSVLLSGGEYEIMEMFIKAYPGCGHVLPTAQAVVELVNRYALKAEDIRRCVVGTRQAGKDYPGCDNKGPFTGSIAAMTSHQFMVASGILNGGVSIPDVKNFADPRVAALSRLVDVVVDPEVEALPGGGGRLVVELNDGRRLESVQKSVVPFSDIGVRQRLIANGRECYSPARATALLEKGEDMEKLEDICDFADLMSGDLESCPYPL